MAEKPQYAKPSSQLDLEERLANGNASHRELSTSPTAPNVEDGDGRTYAVEGNDLDEYVGVSSEYATYANETDKPLRAEDSVEQEVLDKFVEDQKALNNVAVAGSDESGEDEGSTEDGEAAGKADGPFDSK